MYPEGNIRIARTAKYYAGHVPSAKNDSVNNIKRRRVILFFFLYSSCKTIHNFVNVEEIKKINDKTRILLHIINFDLHFSCLFAINQL